MSTLKIITTLAREQLELERDIADAEENLKTLRERHRKLTEDDLPEAMDAADVQKVTLTDGRKLEVAESYHAKIPENRRAEAFAFLRKIKRHGSIKRLISVSFGKGDDELAEQFVTWLKGREKLADKVTDKEDIHHSTLKALVRELAEDGIEFPQEAFGFHKRRFTKIT